MEKKSGSLLAGLIGLGVLLAVLSGAYFWANTQVYSAEAQVQRHLNALVSGDLEAAINIAQPNPESAGAMALPAQATLAATAKLSDAKITNVTESDGIKTVTAELQSEDAVSELTYTLTKQSRNIAAIFPNWRVSGFDYPVIEMTVPGNTTRLDVNGATVDLTTYYGAPASRTEQLAVKLFATPGEYSFKAKSDSQFFDAAGSLNFTVPAVGVATATPGAEQTGLNLLLNEAGKAEVVRLARAQIDECIKQDSPVPAGCHFEAWTDFEYTDGSWELLSYPELVIDAERETFAGGGEAGIGTAGAAVFRYTLVHNGQRLEKEVPVWGDGYFRALPDQSLEIAFNR